MFRIWDVECDNGHLKENVLVDCDAKSGEFVEKISCEECAGEMHRVFSLQKRPETRFQPFWSDTMQARINDRQDLAKLREYAKANGLVNVGHTQQSPDRAAIKHNYEND